VTAVIGKLLGATDPGLAVPRSVVVVDSDEYVFGDDHYAGGSVSRDRNLVISPSSAMVKSS
jgi:hypothetical protein